MSKLSLLLALLLGACAIGPSYERPSLDLPKDYGVQQSAVPAPQKW